MIRLGGRSAPVTRAGHQPDGPTGDRRDGGSDGSGVQARVTASTLPRERFWYHVLDPGPIGPVGILSTTEGVARLYLGDTLPKAMLPRDDQAPWWHTDAIRLLGEYLGGAAVRLDHLPRDVAGTRFQFAVWDALTRIPRGQVITYGELARRIGRSGAARAVGAALKANPLPILVPCHRVVASGGRLGGFTPGLSIKRALLRIEGLEF